MKGSDHHKFWRQASPKHFFCRCCLEQHKDIKYLHHERLLAIYSPLNQTSERSELDANSRDDSSEYVCTPRGFSGAPCLFRRNIDRRVPRQYFLNKHTTSILLVDHVQEQSSIYKKQDNTRKLSTRRNKFCLHPTASATPFLCYRRRRIAVFRGPTGLLLLLAELLRLKRASSAKRSSETLLQRRFCPEQARGIERNTPHSLSAPPSRLLYSMEDKFEVHHVAHAHTCPRDEGGLHHSC